MNKTNVLIIRVNDLDLQLIQEAAKREDMTVSSFIRNAARDRANTKWNINYGKDFTEEDKIRLVHELDETLDKLIEESDGE